MGLLWQSTCTAIKDGREPGWESVKDYREPLLLIVKSKDPRGQLGETEDVVQEILLEIKEHLYATYDRHSGRFRNYLCGVVRVKLAKRWSKRKRLFPLEALPEPEAPTRDEVAAVDLVAESLAAVRRWHARLAQGDRKDLTRIYVVAGRLVRGLGVKEIAQREGISVATVKRTLAQMRHEVIGEILERTLDLEPEAKRGLDWVRLGALVHRSLGRPRERAQLLGELGGDGIAGSLESWLDGFGEALASLPNDGSGRIEDLRGGLEVIFGQDPHPEEGAPLP